MSLGRFFYVSLALVSSVVSVSLSLGSLFLQYSSMYIIRHHETILSARPSSRQGIARARTRGGEESSGYYLCQVGSAIIQDCRRVLSRLLQADTEEKLEYQELATSSS